ncbi:UNVERIFIED_CONTAM: hypothetical protein Cloal_0739 [Acetivibrio alkalicellulosi]
MSKIKDIILFISIFILLSLAGLVVFDIKNEAEQSTGFTTYSDREDGVKVLYTLAEKMGFQVGRNRKPSRFLPDNVTVVAIAPDYDIFTDNLEQKYLLEWVNRGNSFVIIDSDSNFSNSNYDILSHAKSYSKAFSYYGENRIYNIGEGKVIYLGQYENYTNKEIESLDPGVVFIHALNEASNERVLFNEYYQGFGSSQPSIFDIIGFGGRLILIQILLGIMVYFYILSRRFGKPVIVYETIKREENENIFALSNIYKKANANAIVLEIYYDKFKKDVSKFLGLGGEFVNDEEMISEANKNNVLKNMDLQKVIKDCNNYISNNINNRKVLEELLIKLEKIGRLLK